MDTNGSTPTTTTTVYKPYSLYFVNHGYFSIETFSSAVEAIDYAKTRGFEASIICGFGVVGSWSPLTGYRRV